MANTFRMLRRTFLYTILVFCMFFNAEAQHSIMDMEECMRFGMKQNLNVKTAQVDARTAQNNYIGGIGSFLPEVEAYGNGGKRFGRSVDPRTNMYTSTSFIESNIGLNMSLSIFEGFTRINNVKFDRLNKQISILEVQQAENKIAYNVMAAFYNVQLEERLLEHTREQRKLTEKYLRQMKTFLELGMKSATDLQELKARLDADIYQETYRENRKHMAILTLKQLLNLPERDSLSIRYPEDNLLTELPEVIPADSIFQTALNILPETQAMELKINAARKSLAIAKGAFSPTLKAEYSLYSGFYDTERDEQNNVIPFKTQIDNNFGQYLGLKLTIPIFTGLKRITHVKNERLKLHRTEIQVQQEKQILQADIENACLSLQSSAKEYFTAQEQLKANALTLKLTHRKWEEGLISLFELMETRNRYIASQAEVTRTNIQYNLQCKTVKFYTTGSFFNNENK